MACRAGSAQCARLPCRPTVAARCATSVGRRVLFPRPRPRPRARRRRACSSPASTVTGRSVLSRSVRHGIPRTVVSSCMPPESVRTSRESATRLMNSTYGSGSMTLTADPARRRSRPRVAEPRRGSRMGREDERQIRADPLQGRNPPLERDPVVDVGRSVERDDPVLARGQAHLRCHPAPADPRHEGHQGVDHHVADQEDPVVLNAFPSKVGHAVLLGREQVCGQGVRHDPVYLLGHPSVEAAEPGLDVSHRHARLGSDEGGCQRRVHVANHQDQIRPAVAQHRFEGGHHAARLRAMRARPDPKLDVRCGHPELAEKDIGHRDVIVLAGVDERAIEGVGGMAEGRHERRHLHEVGSRPDRRT